MRDWSNYDRVGAIIEFENGEQSIEDTIQLFQHLVDTGLAWSLQGSYGHTAVDLIDRGWVSNSVDDEPLVSIDEIMEMR